MIDFSKFESISPYTDEEMVAALSEVASHPEVGVIQNYFFPNEKPDFLKNLMLSVRSVDELQSAVMSKVVEWVIEHTMHNFSYDGINNINPAEKFVLMSNHRDIILDPALTQLIFFRNGIPMTEIAVGDNLLSNPIVEKLIRSNRMVKVVRGISARELYLSSQLLSEYIRLRVTSGTSSIWLAQRQGRTKNGADTTEQGLLKMLDMSGTKGFVENFMELNLTPMAISYEYEPCDILKARELLISRTQKYVKAEGEDLNSIITGVKQQKGNVHLHIGPKLTEEEITKASECDKNDRYQYIRHIVDYRVVDGYKLWKTNYIAYDLDNRGNKYADLYTEDEKKAFTDYMESQIDTVDKTLNRAGLREIFLHIYSNPVLAKENLSDRKPLPGWNS
ncbi:MAG: 1-acyl-sn-glycerol-3-phosphate acyltransferase [Bacteroidales bacterium]|nr:1-acyl-sn-glycerol-3-phosphate acyltransferase [Bacteroidales bacterium]